MKSEFVNIEKGNIALRIIALIMDAVLTLFIFIGLSALVMTPIANKAFHYEDIQASQFRYQVGSHLLMLYDTDAEGNFTSKDIYKVKDFGKINNDTKSMMIYSYAPEDMKDSELVAFIKERVKYYYCNYRIGYNIEVPDTYKASDFRAPNYQEYLKQKTPEGWESWFNSKYAAKTALKDARQMAYDAAKDLFYSSYYQDGQKSLQNIQLFIILPSYALSFSIFFIVIPLCFKNGETLGKKTFHLGLLAKDGYAVKKRQIVLRQVSLLLYCGLASFVVGIGLTSFATLFIGVFIYFVATLISKSKRSPFDYLAYTIVIDTRKSVWYKDEFEETSMSKEFDENMKKYRKGPVENKNVIQVGSTIINEEIKEEVEKASKKKSK
jgi:uncharacterized RDD family membrane protein YckC